MSSDRGLPMPGNPIVTIDSGTVQGRIENGLSVFRGIPYAAPPQGPLRMQAPVRVDKWDGVRPALRYSAAPPQLPLTPGTAPLWHPGDGLDCLSVNVWTPGGAGDRLPVMVWIYGGGWKSGSSSDAIYDGAALARGGVVMVTFNYRVGFEGFGWVPGAPANRGFLDQTAALRWVHDNIAVFGGDPDNVTLFGESGGGASVAALMSAPGARGLFRRAIVQSIAGRFLPEQQARRIAEITAAALGVTLGELAEQSPLALLAVQDEPLAAMEADPASWATPEAITASTPVIDGVTVVDKPWLALRSGVARDIDLITGFTHDEFNLFAMGLGLITPSLPAMVKSLPALAKQAIAGLRRDGLPRTRPRRRLRTVELSATAAHLGLPASAPAAYHAAYPNLAGPQLYSVMYSDALFRMPTFWLAEAHTAAGGRSYVYDFAWIAPAFGGALGACHTIDIPAALGNTDGPLAAFLLGGHRAPETLTHLSEQVRASWISFAATGDPGWPRFSPAERPVQIWNTEPSVAADPLAASRRIWQELSTR